ncbi:uncharacterized membrane protein YciS (DUF1049 family) [Bradyrhizobium sp. USDA 3240]
MDTFFAIWFAVGWMVFALTLLRMLWAAFQAGDLKVSSYLGGTFLLADYNRRHLRILLCAFAWCLIGVFLYDVIFSVIYPDGRIRAAANRTQILQI